MDQIGSELQARISAIVQEGLLYISETNIYLFSRALECCEIKHAQTAPFVQTHPLSGHGLSERPDGPRGPGCSNQRVVLVMSRLHHLTYLLSLLRHLRCLLCLAPVRIRMSRKDRLNTLIAIFSLNLHPSYPTGLPLKQVCICLIMCSHTPMSLTR